MIYAKTIIHLSVGESAGYFLYFGDYLSTFQLSIKTKGLGLLSILKHRSKRCLWIILFTQANLRSFD